MNASWAVGGVCVAAGLGLLLYRLADDGRDSSSTASHTALSRDKLLEVLKDLRKETSSALITLAGFALSIKEQTENKIDDAYLREVLMAQSPLKDQLKRAEQKVYDKHEVTESQVQAAYFGPFKDDSEVKRIAVEMQQAMDNAYRGITPQSDSGLPDFLTPDMVVELMRAMYESTAKVTQRKMKELHRQGVAINPYDPKFIAATQSMEAEVEEAKERVFERFGMTTLDDPPALVLNQAVQRYSRNMRFATSMAAVENEYKSKMQSMMMGRMAAGDSEEDEADEKLLEYVETSMMGPEERIIEERLKEAGKVQVVEDAQTE